MFKYQEMLYYAKPGHILNCIEHETWQVDDMVALIKDSFWQFCKLKHYSDILTESIIQNPDHKTSWLFQTAL